MKNRGLIWLSGICLGLMLVAATGHTNQPLAETWVAMSASGNSCAVPGSANAMPCGGQNESFVAASR